MERLSGQVVLLRHLDQPVHQDRAHLRRDVALQRHVVGVHLHGLEQWNRRRCGRHRRASYRAASLRHPSDVIFLPGVEDRTERAGGGLERQLTMLVHRTLSLELTQVRVDLAPVVCGAGRGRGEVEVLELVVRVATRRLEVLELVVRVAVRRRQ